MGDTGNIDLSITLELKSTRPLRQVGIGIMLSTKQGIKVSHIPPKLSKYIIPLLDGVVCCELRCESINRFLASGEYIVGFWITLVNVQDLIAIDHAGDIYVTAYDHFGSGRPFRLHTNGVVPLPLEFSYSYSQDD
jgi:hypothetical protein